MHASNIVYSLLVERERDVCSSYRHIRYEYKPIGREIDRPTDDKEFQYHGHRGDDSDKDDLSWLSRYVGERRHGRL